MRQSGGISAFDVDAGIGACQIIRHIRLAGSSAWRLAEMPFLTSYVRRRFRTSINIQRAAAANAAYLPAHTHPIQFLLVGSPTPCSTSTVLFHPIPHDGSWRHRAGGRIPRWRCARWRITRRKRSVLSEMYVDQRIGPQEPLGPSFVTN